MNSWLNPDNKEKIDTIIAGDFKLTKELQDLIDDLGKDLIQEFSWENPLAMFKKETTMIKGNPYIVGIESSFNPTADREKWLEAKRREEELYGESTRVPAKWGGELWEATILDPSDLPNHSYTVKELRNVIDGMWEDIGIVADGPNPFPEYAGEISWDLSELEEIYRKLYDYMQENPSEEYDDPWGSWGLD